jgi:hypothetical protein
VRATNASGNSSYSNTASATTPLAPPTAPTTLTATANSGTSVTLGWQDNAGNESGFLIERKTGTGSYSLLATVGQGVESYTDTTVSANTQYTYRVRATNTAGSSAYTNTATVTTPQVAPAAPTNLDAIAAGPTQIDLDWTDNSSNETNFLIERQTGSGSFVQIASVGANISSYSDTTVSPNTSYTYRVRATNSAGNSVYGAGASATTPQIVITPPSALSATLDGSTAVNLSWTDNSDNETGFLLERKTGSGSYAVIATLDAGVTSYSDSGLATDTTYTYRVRGTNGMVNSGYSNTSSVTTPQTAPAAPSGLTASANDETEVDLNWTDNATNETGFVIERSTRGGSYVQIATVGAGVSSYGDTDVTPDTQYSYRVRATNGAGSSGNSNVASVTTPAVAPAAPSDLAVALADTTQVVIVWNDNSNNETGFIVERSDNGGSFVAVATVGAGVMTYADTGLTADTDYSYRVRALNDVGSSSFTNTVNAHTAPPLDLAGNDLASATAVGSMQPGQVKVAQETVGTQNDRYDLYKLDLVTTTAVDVRLLDMIGDADLQILDSSGNRLAYAKHSGSVDEVITMTLSAGSYYVRVLSTKGLETSYRLRMETELPSVGGSNPLANASDLGAISTGAVKAVDGEVGVSDRNDLYKFTLTGTTKVNFRLSGLSDDADLMILNGNGDRIAYSKKSGTTAENFTLRLSAGTYYVRVAFIKGISSTLYRLRLAGA